jgi:superfamily II DNA or RNA helicase
MSQPIKIAHNAINAKIFTENKALKAEVSQLLSYEVEGAEHMSAFGPGKWNGRSSFFSHRSSSFPAGFAMLVHDELIRKGHQIQLIREPLPKPLGPENPIVDEFGNDDPRYAFQLQALHQVEKHGRGILQVATGGGKSKIAKLIMARYNRFTLFLTTRGVLMYQMRDQVEAPPLKFRCGILGDSQYTPTKGINLGMVQTFVARLKPPSFQVEFGELLRKAVQAEIDLTDKVKEQLRAEAQRSFEDKNRTRERTIRFLELVEVVIGEEAHEAGGDSYYEILRHCKNAQIRVALTATPFMRENVEDNMRLMAAFGDILIKVTEKQLIDVGILATPYFLYANYEPHPKLRRTSPWQRAYQLGIMEAVDRNSRIIQATLKAKHYGLPVMILIQRTKHGHDLALALKSTGLNVSYIRGEHDQDERKRALTKLEQGKIDVLIGTTILDVGVDVPAVGLVCLAGGGKAEVALRQRIGRGLRAKKRGPNVAFIMDFNDGMNSYLIDHCRQRRLIIEGTEGFAERILPPGKDFPWELFAEERQAA